MGGGGGEAGGGEEKSDELMLLHCSSSVHTLSHRAHAQVHLCNVQSVHLLPCKHVCTCNGGVGGRRAHC